MSSPLTLVQAVAAAKRDAVETMRRARKDGKRRIARIESNFLAMYLLGEAGVELGLSRWSPESAQLELQSARELPKVRRALGVPIKPTGGRDLVERSRSKVWVYMEASGFPGLQIRYKAKLPKEEGARKCRVVRTRQTVTYRRLVCET